MALVQRNHRQLVRLGDRSDRDIREARMPASSLGCIAKHARDPRRSAPMSWSNRSVHRCASVSASIS
jgi:hypothetical protein